MAGQNGVPRWVEERFKAIEKTADERHEEMAERFNKLADKQESTRDMVLKLAGMAAGIGAVSGALVSLVLRLAGQKP